MSVPDRHREAISPERDRNQSRMLLGFVVPLLAGATVYQISYVPLTYLLWSSGFSLAFALFAWRVRAATFPAGAVGGMVCLLLTDAPAPPHTFLDSGLIPLIALFVLTFAATHFRRSRKEELGVAEVRTGRRASQILANLGMAALCAAVARRHPAAFAAALAALGEATADTLSSEIGQAIGGRPILLTTFSPVPLGTDGAISLAGTASGLIGAAVVISLGLPLHLSTFPIYARILVAAAAGLFFDSFLGATIERRGYLGNDLVNFTSTALSAAIAYFLLRGPGSAIHM